MCCFTWVNLGVIPAEVINYINLNTSFAQSVICPQRLKKPKMMSSSVLHETRELQQFVSGVCHCNSWSCWSIDIASFNEYNKYINRRQRGNMIHNDGPVYSQRGLALLSTIIQHIHDAINEQTSIRTSLPAVAESISGNERQVSRLILSSDWRPGSRFQT